MADNEAMVSAPERRGQDGIARQLTARRDSTLARKCVQEALFDRKSASLARRLGAIKNQRLHLTEEVALQTRKLAHGLAALERERAASALGQELAETEARRRFVVVAPQDGTVTAILTEAGGNAFATAPLMSLVPAGSRLQAQLFSPSRSIGFVRQGQRVSQRFQPFSYQKFGFYTGAAASISRSPVSPSELPHQLTGLADPQRTGEPVYRVIVDLDKQSVEAYGKSVPLQPGMQRDADVVIETRRLIEWVLDPIYALTGKMG